MRIDATSIVLAFALLAGCGVASQADPPAAGDGGPGGDDGGGNDGGGVAAKGDASTCTGSDLTGCPCTAGGQQVPCYTGLPATRHVGTCSDGVQTCSTGHEFPTYGPCTGDTLPSPEVCDGRDTDCDGVADDGCVDSGTTRPPTGACPPLTVGALHACAITPAGGVKCWGYNNYGQLGNGSTTDSNVPVDVVGLTSGVKCLAAGELHTCALTTSGGVKCWGTESFAFINPSDAGAITTPVDVPGLQSGVVGIASGEFDTCALLADGGTKGWGGGSEIDQDPTTSYGAVPVSISGVPSGITALVVGDGFNCVLATAGVECWGSNSRSELGNGTKTPSATPVPVTGLGSGVTAIGANGGSLGCAVLTGGNLECWGDLPGGQSNQTPMPVAGLSTGVAAVSPGGESEACVLMTDGSVQCWGTLGAGGKLTPTPIAGLSSVVYVATNEACSCALLANGKIECWAMLDAGVGPGIYANACIGNPANNAAGWGVPVEVQGF